MSFTLTRSLTALRSRLPCTSLHPFLRSTYSTTTNEQHIQRKLPRVGPHRFKEFDLADRVYAVTGGGRGLGLAMAEALMEAGAKVYCLDRLEKPHPEFETAKGQAEKEYGGALEYRRIDVRNEPEVNDVFAEIASRDKRLDGLIAAAGINHLQSALEHSQSALNEVMQINYNGVFNSATAAARQMFKYQRKGSILLVASMSGLIANKGMTSPVYNSSKAAVIQLARSLAMEWGRQGIRVNSLCPGHVLTPMVEQVFEQNPAAKAIWEAENMLGRLACPEEFRGAALFALSDASSFMTGSTMIIDGGHTAW
ncbi:putative short chain dehydrogenase/oxidoreductase [Aspergillus lentulus]|uniref:Short chain dehydrogenase/oxidoreductase n=1 Tax=Aspergillus lentulus TaxID=293939 RepID=A0ABQ1B266_ASPLE|nr:putative short chain dehydrogenase/oxidoreductase [Aspergillus lentulus]GFF95234.1 putative short chain dehydrogenase/oxidoreductase [Aspergillus lentulus]GFG16700.1 putative short chain dehydrogenase/oxidoreductase [Aspergillus lentulus]